MVVRYFERLRQTTNSDEDEAEPMLHHMLKDLRDISQSHSKQEVPVAENCIIL